MHTDSCCWKEVDISSVKTGDIVAICDVPFMRSGWPDLQRKYKYRYSTLIDKETITMTNNGLKIVTTPFSKFPESFLIYKLMDVFLYSPDQEPEDDCL